MLKIAIISDLHVGSGSRAADLWPSGTGASLDPRYLENFLAFLTKSSIEADLLILPGDVAHLAQPDEFELASQVLFKIADALKVSHDRIYYVPGNHDVDWSVLAKLSPDPTGLRLAMRWAPLRNPPWLFDKILRRGHRHLLDEPFAYTTWSTPSAFVLGFNSASHDLPDSKVHHGLVTQETLDDARAHLAGQDLSGVVRIGLVHHHPLQYSDPVPNEPDFSAMTNAGNLLNLLHDFKFDLLIHGHKHAPRLTTQVINNCFPMVVVGAGGFSVRLDPRWSGLVNNQFHLVRVEGRDSSGCTRGELVSWTYLSGHGWVPSETSNGIAHRVPFGTHVGEHELELRIAPVITSALSTSSYVEWKTVVAAVPEIAFIAPDTTARIVDRLSVSLNFRRHGTPPDDVVLLRGA